MSYSKNILSAKFITLRRSVEVEYCKKMRKCIKEREEWTAIPTKTNTGYAHQSQVKLYHEYF